ncbi:MAG: hypothetical protein COB46_11920 [Rhodospirillaceae bacterium]|nr:MAG: hypothetical protein COB46_11920 [Rhodospirillaceae bacterium]
MPNFSPIVLFCDFGLPYTGQMKARLLDGAPECAVIDLFHDVPAHDIQAGSALLAAHVRDFPKGTIFVCVVDPGVGTDQRKPGVVFAGGWWFVGPLNGLFEHVLRQFGSDAEVFEITEIPKDVSVSFHGRDIFAPQAARLAVGNKHGLRPLAVESIRKSSFVDDVQAVIYSDGFGNLMTGIRAKSLPENETIEISGRKLPKYRTFSDAQPGEFFVYENAVGLLEISANQANARKILKISGFPPLKIVQV